jgi:hypothetical protein
MWVCASASMSISTAPLFPAPSRAQLPTSVTPGSDRAVSSRCLKRTSVSLSEPPTPACAPRSWCLVFFVRAPSTRHPRPATPGVPRGDCSNGEMHCGSGDGAGKRTAPLGLRRWLTSLQGLLPAVLNALPRSRVGLRRAPRPSECWSLASPRLTIHHRGGSSSPRSVVRASRCTTPASTRRSRWRRSSSAPTDLGSLHASLLPR